MSDTSRFDVFQAARSQPRTLALVTAEDSLTYEDMARLANRACAWLAKRGISGSAGEPVAVLARGTPGQVAMCHALWALGVAVLPVHPSLTAGERVELLGRAGARLCIDEFWQEEAPLAGLDRPPHAGADDETSMAILQTSGSGGVARLCRLSRRAFRASAGASAERLGWQPTDSWLLCLPFAHIGGLSVLTRCLDRRATVHTTRSSPGGSATEALSAALSKHKPSLVSLVPTQLVRLLDLPGFDLPNSVRLILVGGAELPRAIFARARRRGWPIVPSYGLTEACSQVATAQLGDNDPSPGRPLAGVEVRIRAGQIEVRGEVMFSGYLGEPEWSPETWFQTGDLGELDESGRLHVLGRVSDRIVTGGENVDPVEVEGVFAGSLDRRICVAGRAHTEWGEQVVLFIEGPYDAGILRDVVELARNRLAPFKRPRLCAFVVEFPMGPSGKILRRSLASLEAPVEALTYSLDNA